MRDLGSRNGTFVDGKPARIARDLAAPVVRMGHTLILPVADGRAAGRDPLARRARARVPPVPGAATTASVHLVEACMLRRWPGNVRELLTEVRIAALTAKAAGRAAVAATDLDPDAGRAMEAPPEGAPPEGAPLEAAPDEAPAPDRREIEAALRAERGNVTRAAARLGVSRIRIRRYIEREGIDVRTLRS